MSTLADDALARLRVAADQPDLGGTPYAWRGRLGRGGMGVVHRVHDSRLGRDVALKVLDLAPAAGAEAERLRREARILAALEHPGIVPVHDVGVLADGRPFYVMKLVAGESLERHAIRGAPLGERLRLFARLCEPVAFAHERGVVHRDLKPGNVMVGPFGEVLVLDWGVARLPGDAPAAPDGVPASTAGPDAPRGGTGAGAVLGTAGFMAPEQARGDSATADARADVYGLGAVLRFLLAGEIACGALPRPLHSLLARAGANAPEDRYASVRELAEDVVRFLDRRPLMAHRETVAERLGRAFARHQTAIVLVLAYLVLRLLFLLLRD